MKRFLRAIFRYPWLIIIVTALITGFFAAQLPRVRLNNDNVRFVPEKDKAREISKYIDDAFGSSVFVLVGLEREYGDVFDKEFLERIRSFSARVSEKDIVGDINSIMDTEYITSEEDAIVVEKLVPDDFSGTAEEIAEIKRRLLSWDMYKRALISDDFSATQILVPLSISSEDTGNPEIVSDYMEIRDIAYEMFADLAGVYVTGLPIISGAINEAMQADLRLLIPLVVAVLLVVVFIPLKRISFVALSMLSVVLAVVWSVGAMPLFGVELSVVSTVLPVVLMAIGSSYGIHLIIHYIEDSGKNLARITKEEHTELIINLVETLGVAIFLAALTTLASFLSFCFTAIEPIREFGLFSAFGVFASFLITITLTPAILILRGPRGLHKLRIGNAESGRAAQAIADFLSRVVSHKYAVLIVVGIIAAVSVYGAAHLVIDNIFLEYFKPSSAIVKSDDFIREQFGGSKVISVMVEADNAETLLHPDVLSAFDGLSGYLMEHVEGTGKVMGFTDLVKRVNQVFNADESPAGIGSAAADTGAGGVVDEGGGFGFGGFDDFGDGAGDSAAVADTGAGDVVDEGGDFGFGDFGDGAGDSVVAADTGAGGTADEGGSFGFGDFGDGADDSAVAADTGADEAADEDAPYTGRDIAALLDQAAGNGRERGRDLAWEVKRLVNYEGAAYYEIPADPARYGVNSKEDLQRLVSNYLVLLSGNISDYANDALEPTAIKSTVQLRTVGGRDTNRVVSAINDYVAANFPRGENAPQTRVIVGGAALVEASVNTNVVSSVWSSMLIALVSMFIIISVSNRSAIAGIIAVITLGALILINFAIMSFLGIKLNIGTALIASLTMGIGIDYTIHFLEAYKREYRASGGQGGYLKKAYLTSGIAILTDAGSVAFGFLVLLLSRFTMLADFGLLVAIAMTLAAAAGLVLVPALLLVIKPKFVQEKD
jgi:predicted RND superfamily exporter protein